ncbi:MAG: efflux RND transporter periplasmic adaptor subunit [Intestinimonas sp.]|nr:efflux RND transporter periplasmic adaptor subunit [Intestinimonas sp.]
METTQLKPEANPEKPASPTPAAGGTAHAPFKPKKKRKWPKRLIIFAVIAAAVFFLFIRPRLNSSGSSVLSSYLPTEVIRQDLTVSVSGTGTIQPNDSFKATPLVKGEILEAPFEEGDTVHKGDLLFRIDAKDVENQIQQAQLSLQQAQVTYNNLLKTRSDNNTDRTITAPATGVIEKLYVNQDDSITTGSTIADLLDRTHLKLVLPFHSADTANIYIGEPAAVTVDGSLETVQGTVDFISAADEVGAGGALIRQVTILVVNPGALSDSSSGTAVIGSSSCSASGTFQYITSKKILAKTSGNLDHLYVKEGDLVGSGQTLGVIAATDMDAQIENARIAVDNAKLTLQNAQDSLDDYSITSPIDGKVIEKNYKVGDNIDTSASTTTTYMAVVYDLSRLTFDMNIDELDISKVQVGQTVNITVDALDSRSFTGHVDKINVNGTTKDGATTYPVTIVVDDPQDLLPGMNVSATIISETIPDALCIPVDAVARNNMVTVADPGALSEDGSGVVDSSKLREVQVTLGRSNDQYIEVLDGLSEGDVVVIQNVSSNFYDQMRRGD